ncbi:MAG: hypothetical protein M1831_006020 [Alyxoria varia]|nr:MAG: hypothetical protein M1831_006020 [Alyxoria varia]
MLSQYLTTTNNSNCNPQHLGHRRLQSSPIIVAAPQFGVYSQNHPQPSGFGSPLAYQHLRPMSSQGSPTCSGLTNQYQQQHTQVGNTNPGTNYQQHFAQQAAQAQSPTRPGLHQQQYQNNQYAPIQSNYINGSEIARLQEAYKLREQEQQQQLQAKFNDDLAAIFRGQGLPSVQNNEHPANMERSKSHPGPQSGAYPGVFVEGGNNLQGPNQFQMNCGQHGHNNGRPTSSQSMYMPEKRFSLQEENLMTLQKPFTPPQQGNPSHPSMTPNKIPYNANGFEFPIGQQFYGLPQGSCNNSTSGANSIHMSPCTHSRASSFVANDQHQDMNDPNATIKPKSQPKAITNATFLPSSPASATPEGNHLPSPPHTVSQRNSGHFDAAMMPDNFALDEFSKVSLESPDPNGHPQPSWRPGLHQRAQESVNSFASQPSGVCSHDHSRSNSSVEMAHQLSQNSITSTSTRSSFDQDANNHPKRVVLSPGKSQNEDVEITAIVEPTGITSQQIQSYIGETSDAKFPFVCRYGECVKLFSRKENARSHVQTHLNDRQFKCPDCNARFVRAHDLKRHALMHTGEKKYWCACNRGFSRQDALTRHRDRGICEGAFDWVVPKFAKKRGRPPKNQSNGQQNTKRQNKAAATRQRNQQKQNEEAQPFSTPQTSDETSFGGSPPGLELNDFLVDPPANETSNVQGYNISDAEMAKFLADVGNHLELNGPPQSGSPNPANSPLEDLDTHMVNDGTDPNSTQNLGSSNFTDSNVDSAVTPEQPAATHQLETVSMADMCNINEVPRNDQNGQEVNEMDHSNDVQNTTNVQGNLHQDIEPQARDGMGNPGSPNGTNPENTPDLVHSSPPSSQHIVDFDIGDNNITGQEDLDFFPQGQELTLEDYGFEIEYNHRGDAIFHDRSQGSLMGNANNEIPKNFDTQEAFRNMLANDNSLEGLYTGRR